METFLSAANPRVRALGGTRFDGASQPAPEWQAFGSFCFMIPRLELLEAAGCCLLSCTLAWKPQLGPQDRYALPDKSWELMACLHHCAHDRSSALQDHSQHIFWLLFDHRSMDSGVGGSAALNGYMNVNNDIAS